MSLVPVRNTLAQKFQRQRIVLWDDAAGEWVATYHDAIPEGVTTIPVNGDSLCVKHRVLREEPQGKFLLYFGPGPRWTPEEDLLYDLRATYGPVFTPNQVSLSLIETGLSENLSELGHTHATFFADPKLKDRLRGLLAEGEKEDGDAVRLRMIEVLTEATGGDLRDLLLAVLSRFAEGDDAPIAALEQHKLSGFLWSRIQQKFEYAAKSPSWKDFAYSLLDASDAPVSAKGCTVNPRAARALINDWRNHADYWASYMTFADAVAKELNLSKAYEGLDKPEALLDREAHREADRRLITLYGDMLLRERPPLADIRKGIAARTGRFWAKADERLGHLWQALAHATELTALLEKPDLVLGSFDEGLAKYRDGLHRIDRHYRKFIFHLDAAGQGEGELARRLGGRYVHNFLNELAARWQPHAETARPWGADRLPSQRKFFERFVAPILKKNQKVCVIISDALRYEIGDELRECVLSEPRWAVERAEAMLGVLPSYTQAGMAALLPHDRLSFSPKLDGGVLADEVPTQGTPARAEILQRQLADKGVAVTAEEFLGMHSATEGRDFSKNYPVIYVYQNGIDKTGDDRQSENKVFRAAEETLKEILAIMRKAAAINITHVVVTADHGFLYQHQEVAETEFVPSEAFAASAGHINRRFVIGQKLPAMPDAMKFTAAELGFAGEGEVLIPKGNLRFRQKGSGSRYVHGGASLQEILVPALHFRKERADNTEKVEVELIGTTSQRKITTGQIALRLFQAQPVDDRFRPRSLRLSFKSEDGKPLSDTKLMRFESTDPEDRHRDQKVTLIFNREADAHSGKKVFLHLEEPIEGTDKFIAYATEAFEYRRSIAGDFDF